MEIQPDAFDLIVLGTGLQESLIAAAASTAGLTVLHLDREPHYGSHWASFSLDGFQEWAAVHSTEQQPSGGGTTPQDRPVLAGLGPDLLEHCLPWSSGHEDSIYRDVEVVRHPGAELGESNQYNIDLAPKVVYTVGPMVETLIRCKADSYLVFRLVHSFVWQNGAAVGVPASRADIFKDSNLAPAQKRTLMRFLKNTMDALEDKGSLKDSFDERPFQLLLEQEQLPVPLQSVIMYCLAMLPQSQTKPEQQQRDASAEHDISRPQSAQALVDESSISAGPEASPEAHSSADFLASESGAATAAEGLRRMATYVESVSRYGGGFMAADYGAGELPQAFCRTAAVHGATYVLRCPVHSLLEERDRGGVAGVRLASGQVLRSKAVAANWDFIPPKFRHGLTSTGINRAVAVLSAPLASPQALLGKKGDQVLLVIPPDSISPGLPPHPVRVLQMSHQSLATPKDRFLLHLSMPGGTISPEATLAPVLAHISPQAPLLSVYYSQASPGDAQVSLLANLALCQPPDLEVGYGAAIVGAQDSFARLFPGKEFLPAAARAEQDDDD